MLQGGRQQKRHAGHRHGDRAEPSGDQDGTSPEPIPAVHAGPFHPAQHDPAFQGIGLHEAVLPKRAE